MAQVSTSGTSRWHKFDISDRYVLFSINEVDQTLIREQLANVIEILYHLTILCTKVAVLLQYLRIFVPARTRKFYLTWALIAINGTVNVSLAIALAFQCIPRRKIWTPALDGRCIHLGAAFLTSATTNVITDWAVFLLPLSSIWGLQLPWKRKIGVSAVFTVGLLYVVGPSNPLALLSVSELADGRFASRQCVYREYHALGDFCTTFDDTRSDLCPVQAILMGVRVGLRLLGGRNR